MLQVAADEPIDWARLAQAPQGAAMEVRIYAENFAALQQANGLNSDANKSDREKLNRMLEEMFEESDMWLTAD